MEIEQFCDKHGACPSGRVWALANCRTMQEVWEKIKPEWLVWVATREGVLDEVEQRVFAIACARSVSHLLTDQRSHDAIDMAERYVLGDATADMMAAAARAAMDAAWDAEGPARYAALSAWDAARYAALSAMDAALSASDAALAAQAEWLRNSCEPCFEEVQ